MPDTEHLKKDLEEIRAHMETPHSGQTYLASLPSRLLALFQSALSPLERAETGRILAVLGDPREEVSTIEKMIFCRVPAGEFTMRDEQEEDNKPRKVTMPEYFISQFPITNAQFRLFVEADGYKQAKYWEEAKQADVWKDAGFKGIFDKEYREGPEDFGFPFNAGNHPVVGISWYEALAFTRWLDE